MESKHDIGVVWYTVAEALLIEPVWNRNLGMW